MYFIFSILLALAFLGYLLSLAIQNRERTSILINALGILCLVTAVVVELMNSTSREELAAISIALLVVLCANIYLILKGETKKYDEFMETGADFDTNTHEAAFILATGPFYTEIEKRRKEKERRRLTGQWNEALAMVACGKVGEALSAFLHIDAEISTQSARINIAALQIESGQPATALKTLSSFTLREAARWQFIYNQGLAHFKNAAYESADGCFRRLPLEEIDSWRLAYYRGRTLRKLQRDRDAVQYFRQATALAPAQYQPVYYLALSLSKLGFMDDALEYYNKAIELNADDATLWYNRGNILMKLQRYAQAIQSYDRAIERNPGYILAWNNKGIAYTRLGRMEEAIKCYRRALSYDSRYYESLLNCALALDSCGQTEKALEFYSRFLQNAKDNMKEHLGIVKSRIARLSAQWRGRKVVVIPEPDRAGA